MYVSYGHGNPSHFKSHQLSAQHNHVWEILHQIGLPDISDFKPESISQSV